MDKKANAADYLDLGLIQTLFELYSNKYSNVCLSLVDLDENIIVAVNFQSICHTFFRKHPETEKLCVASNKVITNRVAEKGYTEYMCKNGIVDIAMPIKIDNRHICTFYTGQIFIKEEMETDEEYFRKTAKTYGFDEEKFIAAYKKIPIFSREQVKTLTDAMNKEILSVLNR